MSQTASFAIAVSAFGLPVVIGESGRGSESRSITGLRGDSPTGAMASLGGKKEVRALPEALDFRGSDGERGVGHADTFTAIRRS